MKYFLGYKENNKYNKMTDLTPNNGILTLAKFTSNFNNKEELFNYLKTSTLYFFDKNIDDIDDDFFQYITNNGPIDNENVIIYKKENDLINPNTLIKSFVKKIDNFDYDFILNYTFNVFYKYFNDIYRTLYLLTNKDYHNESKENIVLKIIQINRSAAGFIKNPVITNFLIPIYMLIKDARDNPNIKTTKYKLHLRRYAFEYLKTALYDNNDKENKKLNERNLFDTIECYVLSVNDEAREEEIDEEDNSDDEFLETSDYENAEKAYGDSAFKRALEKRK